ncbi:LacI family transcriptional regulator [Microlunatus phosphovorus NM-1]|uniref:LacI family transcriptional regulator n=1 Tax=Microlunatus phosphovorus (strain ATCC 700054 / DSM 10555 / JCM 9379 / NBRC 101784 / NCIMB 13414 / VKM Ac-1990 / NM-1) TaxID=1032480 RepID=F5XII3_MICPN|nr:LacI family DNA-binding transcriptional regulator [Microlunatus phosphovorus]BAK38221.1 LacI family transcriptional regulator [Microlunatus phosphovorus NM-1]
MTAQNQSESAALTKRPSISDVAAAAGVSRAAVSKVIRNAYGVSPAMRERVEAVIAELNYRPLAGARALRGSGFTIGFEIPHLGNDYFNQVVSGAATRLAESRYQLMVAPGLGYLSATAVLDALLDRQMDGVIAIASQVPAEQLESLAARVPLVLLGRHEQSAFYDTVTGDDKAGATLVMDHLLDLGHRRISHLTMRPPTPQSPHAARLATYTSRMKQAGLEPDVTFVESEEEAYDAAVQLLSRGRPLPSAIFAGHDALAIAVLRAVSEAGQSEQIAVVGYDDVELAGHPAISLTTVDQFGHAMGGVAATLLLERLRDGRTDPRHIQQTPELRARGSTRPLSPRN